TVLCLACPQPNRCKDRLDRVRRSKMNPVLCREVVKCQKAFLVLGKTLHGSWVLRLKAGQAVFISLVSCRPRFRHPDVLQGLLYLRLNGFWYFVQDVGCLMHPAALLSRLRPLLGNCFPEA